MALDPHPPGRYPAHGRQAFSLGGDCVHPFALISIKRLAFMVLGAGLVIWILLGIIFRKPRY